MANIEGWLRHHERFYSCADVAGGWSVACALIYVRGAV